MSPVKRQFSYEIFVQHKKNLLTTQKIFSKKYLYKFIIFMWSCVTKNLKLQIFG